MVPQVSVQLYSVREQAQADYEGTIRAIAAMGFENVEPAGYPGTTPAAAATLFAELGLKAPSCHCALPVGDAKQEVIETALLMGHKYVITGCPPNFQRDFATLDSIRALADLYSEAAQNAAEHGLQVGYHNHDWDLAMVEGVRGYRVFLEHTPESVLWEADLFWVARAGINPVDFVREIGPRGVVLHVKDGAVDTADTFKSAETASGKIMVSDGAPFLPAGTGQVDLAAAVAESSCVQYAVVELDSYNGDMLEAIRESYTYLTTNGIASGRL
jgi:sugar phosphate isomerase/epimerase